MNPVWLPALILVPAVAAPLIVLLGRWPNAREAVSLLSAAIVCALAVTLYTAGPEAYGTAAHHLAEPLPGLHLALALEPLGMLFILVAAVLWLVTTIYSIGYMRGHDEQNQTRFFAFFALAIAATMGIALSSNLFSLFVFYEVLTLTTYPLVTHSGTDQAKAGGRVYLGILLFTSIGFFLFALVWTWLLAGSLEFSAGGILRERASPTVLGILFVLYLLGIGKAAVMPFHRWLPAAMVAPTPVSALLHAVAVVKAGVFTVLKISVYIFGPDVVAELPTTTGLLYLAAATILLASLVAMSKDNLKARLAYSTVSQLGYVVLGAVLASSAGIIGGSMHIAMHAVGKITLFFCAGAIFVAAHKTEVSQLGGLGRRMPLTMTAFFIGAVSIAGLPPTGGTWSKWFLALGTLEAGHWVLLWVLMLSSLLNIAYLLSIPVRAFFTPAVADGHGGPAATGIQEAPMACLIAMTITAAGCIALFLFPDALFHLAESLAPPG